MDARSSEYLSPGDDAADGDDRAQSLPRGDPAASRLWIRRREQKYVLDRPRAEALLAAVEAQLPCYEFIAGEPKTWVTTVYFDTQNLSLFRRACRSFDDNLKIRVKEYYYPAPASCNPPGSGASAGSGQAAVSDLNGTEDVSCDFTGADLSGFPRAFQSTPFCYVELKQRHDGTVRKRRFRLPKARLSALLCGEDVWDEVARAIEPGQVRQVRISYDLFRTYTARVRVEPSSTVCYEREVFQEHEDDLRITFDENLFVYNPPASLYEDVQAMTPATLGAPIRRMTSKVILEIKTLRAYPGWLREALGQFSAMPLSKFTSSVRALRDSSVSRPAGGTSAAQRSASRRLSVPSGSGKKNTGEKTLRGQPPQNRHDPKT